MGCNRFVLAYLIAIGPYFSYIEFISLKGVLYSILENLCIYNRKRVVDDCLFV